MRSPTDLAVRTQFTRQSSWMLWTVLLLGTTLMLLMDQVDETVVQDHHLRQLANTISNSVGEDLLARTEGHRDRALVQPVMEHAPETVVYQIWSRKGDLLLSHHQASVGQPLVQLGKQGYFSVRLNGETYRAYAISSIDNQAVIQVAEREREHVRHIGLTWALHSLLLVFPLVVMWHGARLLLVRALHAQESHFSTIAAHELKAPLAGIRAHAELAHSAETEDELKQSLCAVMQGVDRAANAFDQLLDLVRLDSAPAVDAMEPPALNLETMYRQIIDELSAQIAQRQLRVSAALEVSHLRGHPFGMYLIIRNLLSNAVKYTPPGGTVVLRTALHAGAPVMTIDDSGAGIPLCDRERVFARFCRLQPSVADGAGLGLAIVAQAVHLHGASIQVLSASAGGTRVQIVFPAELVVAMPSDLKKD